jgi:hypothetical protein
MVMVVLLGMVVVGCSCSFPRVPVCMNVRRGRCLCDGWIWQEDLRYRARRMVDLERTLKQREEELAELKAQLERTRGGRVFGRSTTVV